MRETPRRSLRADGEAEAELVVLLLVVKLPREQQVDSRRDALLEHCAARGVRGDDALESGLVRLGLGLGGTLAGGKCAP